MILAAGEHILHIIAPWKKAFQSSIDNPVFNYESILVNVTKINQIKKQPTDPKNCFDIEVFIIKDQSMKREIDEERKNGFFIVTDETSFIWLRSKIELQEKH